ncbi:hypothetical protein BP6252_09789 [Coleophoma cylindrospora]|uniref:Uncharacterized protein n=1 Tax=Coleophoma cylindrospora TaxID=1849047 RepID=A0A3D8QX86_9HELO|nr:hypothetical protein BP6252_09789 [Coleophoma cylindrospora]
MPTARLGIEPGSSPLFKVPFDKNRVSMTAYPHSDDPYDVRLVCRWINLRSEAVRSCYGVHELCVKRSGSSLLLRHDSTRRDRAATWVALFFQTWEKMVLFHCTFVSLKARSPYTFAMHPDDYRLGNERRLFRERIVDDGYAHYLSVFRDERTRALRLQATVCEGELRKCPVWTAFVTYQSESVDWLVHKDRYRVWIMDIHLYVFCDSYQEDHQRRQYGAFEIHFLEREAVYRFEDTFYPAPSSPGSSISGSEPAH